MPRIALLIGALVVSVTFAVPLAAGEICPDVPDGQVKRADAEAVIANCLKGMPAMKRFPVKAGVFDDRKSGASQRYRLIAWYAKIGAYPQAIAVLTELIDSAKKERGDLAIGTWSTFLIERAELQLKSGNPDAALADVEASELRDAEFARTVHGRALVGLGRFREAVADFDKVISWTPSDIEARVGRGLAFEGMRELEKAADDFRVALAMPLTTFREEEEKTALQLARAHLASLADASQATSSPPPAAGEMESQNSDGD